ncbi:MAG: nitrous oxide reductase family maturation protein NosD [candidate division Zixibacteria bacterium]|nr:nitrous oxide reductase family maturation protein NosD [candidate division Zixibacteria bacterium]
MRLLRHILLFFLLATSASFGELYSIESNDGLQNILKKYNSGDTICLSNGIYSGPFDIITPLTIIGDSETIIDGKGIGDVLLLSADSITLKKLTVQNSGTRLLKDHAGIKIIGDNIKISDCLIRDNLHGIYVKGGSIINIHNNVIIGRFNIQESDRGNGIHLWNTKNNSVFNNDISFARDGIYFSFANNTEIKENHIHQLRYALHYMYSDSNSFEDNLFDYNVAGSALMFSEHISFKRNVFAFCRGMRAYGILLQSVEYCEAYDNLILDNTKGVFYDDANHNRFENNDIIQNDIAIHLNASCEDNTLLNNNFISNLAEVEMHESAINLTTWSKDESGNFWSGYTGYDIDGNGVGDIPYHLQSTFEFMELDYPAIRFYLYSPAAQLLAAAEKRIPILRKTKVEDKHPLFKRLENDNVPYDCLKEYETKSSFGHMTIWIAIFFLPMGMMWVLRK